MALYSTHIILNILTYVENLYYVNYVFSYTSVVF